MLMVVLLLHAAVPWSADCAETCATAVGVGELAARTGCKQDQLQRTHKQASCMALSVLPAPMVRRNRPVCQAGCCWCAKHMSCRSAAEVMLVLLLMIGKQLMHFPAFW